METSWKRDKYQRRGGLHRNSEDKVEEKAASGSPLHSLIMLQIRPDFSIPGNGFQFFLHWRGYPV